MALAGCYQTLEKGNEGLRAINLKFRAKQESQKA